MGASIVHLRTRDEHGNQTQDLERLQTTIEAIRADNSELIICATTTSRGAESFRERTTALRLPEHLLPDMASLNLGSYNTPFGVNVNPADEIEALLSEMAAVEVKAELEIFEPGMVHFWNHLVAEVESPRCSNR